MRVGVEVAVAWIGIGTTVFDEMVPFILIAAIKAGMRTGLGNWAIGWGHDKCYLGNLI